MAGDATAGRAAGWAGALLDRVTVRQLSLARAAAGAAMLAAPARVPRVLGVDSASATRMAWATRMLGVREVALGLGSAAAQRRPDAAAARLWVWAGLCTDAVDALTLAAGTARGTLSRVTAPALCAASAGAVAVQWRAVHGRD